MKLRILVLLAVFCCTASNIFGYDFQSDDLYYNITSDSTVAVTYQYPKKYSSSNYSGLVSATIPESVTYDGTTYRVTSIGREAFYRCTGLTSVTIPHSVTSIGREAFWGCISLTSIIIPNSVITIGKEAFGYCVGPTSITIPNSVTTIGEKAFQYVANIVYSGTVTGSPWGGEKCQWVCRWLFRLF